jgi:hypothetical protein
MQYGYPVLGAVFALLAIMIWIGGKRFNAGVVFQMGASVFFFWCRFRFPARVRKIYDLQIGSLAGVMTLTSAGMRFERRNGTATTDYTWAAFTTWMERSDMFLAFPNPCSFVRIPKDKLTTAEQDEVRGWLSAHSKLIG